MGWATKYIQELQEGNVVTFTAHGKSMKGKVEDGSTCTVAPLTESQYENLKVGDIVLCKVNGSQYLHQISAIRQQGKTAQYQISNNRGHVNGWITSSSIYGLLFSTS